MTPEDNRIYIQSQMLCAQIECEGMKWENEQRTRTGRNLAYTEDEFNKLIVKYGIHHNAILTQLQDNY